MGGRRGGTAALGPFRAWSWLARTPVAWAAGTEAEVGVGVGAKGVQDERRTGVGLPNAARGDGEIGASVPTQLIFFSNF